jgi:hypothetical protein
MSRNRWLLAGTDLRVEVAGQDVVRQPVSSVFRRGPLGSA